MARLVPPFYLGPYKVVKQLGSGGFATVFRAAVEGDMGFSRDVALKVLHSHITRDSPEVVAMLADEARLLARMQHPNIVYVQWFGKLEHPEDGEVLAMMMEYVEGRTFGSMLHEARSTQSPLPMSVIIDVHIAIAKALAFAHKLKDEQRQPLHLVHRDLKPENVMVSRQGAIKLLDFGIAKATDRLAEATATDLVRGTVHYMSPEQVRGVKDLDFRSDLFSLGAMLFEAVTGARMIGADSVVAAIHSLANFAPGPAVEAITEACPALGPVATTLLAVDRDDRYDKTSDLVRDLEEARRSIDTVQTTETWLADRFQAVGDTAAVETPAELRLFDEVSETVDVPSGDAPEVPPTRPQARVSGGQLPFSSGGPRAAPDPLAPTAAIPSDQAILASQAVEQQPEPKRRSLVWVAVPLVLLGILLGTVGPKLLGPGEPDPTPTATTPAPVTPTAETTPAPEEPEVADPMGEDEEMVVADAEEEEVVEAGDELASGRAITVPPAIATAGPGGSTSEPTRTPAPPAKATPAPTPEIATTTPDAIAEPPPKPGTIRLSADAPFQVTIAGKTWSQLEAKRGIELPAGSYKARFTCLECPEGIVPTAQVAVEVKAGAKTTRSIQFPAEP